MKNLQKNFYKKHFTRHSSTLINSKGGAAFIPGFVRLGKMRGIKNAAGVGGISDYKYEWVRHRISSSGVSYDVQFRVKAGERWYTLTVVTNDKGVEWFSCGESFKTDPLAYFDCWTHWLWQDLEGCYLDFETNEYVYY